MYQIKYDNKRVKKDLEKITQKDREKITQAIEEKLAEYGPRTKGVKRIKTFDEYSLRQGNYRILFWIEGKTINISKIGDRKDVYR